MGIGTQFGGKYFCHDVRVVRLPRHGASCPIGLGVSCSADRQVSSYIWALLLMHWMLHVCYGIVYNKIKGSYRLNSSVYCKCGDAYMVRYAVTIAPLHHIS